MARQRNGSSPRSFYEVVLSGPHDMIHGLLWGLALGADLTPTIVCGHDAHISDSSLREKLSEMLHLHAHHCQVILDGATRGLLKRKAAQVKVRTGVEAVSDRRISRAEFKFHYLAYAPRYGEEIAALLEDRPEGVRLVSHKRKETVDPSAKGTEAYAPAHDYEVKGSGEIRGRIDRVMAFHERLDRHPLVEVEEIELELV